MAGGGTAFFRCCCPAQSPEAATGDVVGVELPHLSKQTCLAWLASQAGTLGKANMPVRGACCVVPTGSWSSKVRRTIFHGTSTACPKVWNRMKPTLGTMRSRAKDRAWRQAGLNSFLSSATENMKWAKSLNFLVGGVPLSYLQRRHA